MDSAPRAIGVIMDGNRRWAKERGLSTFEGHQAGAQKIFELAAWARAAGIEEVILYTFSTENWNRTEEEIGHLMGLAERLFAGELARFESSGIRIRFIGQRERMSVRMQQVMGTAEERTKDGSGGTLVFALSYGGRSEIVAAVNRLLRDGKGSVDEQGFSDALDTQGLRDPDLVLRTGGERRLSNFLPWQSAYSELFFIDTKWPDLSKEEFDGVLAEYAERDRRHGK